MGKGFKFYRAFNAIAFIGAAAFFFLLPAIVCAQDLPCDGDDPYATCPIDSAVWLLAAAVTIFAFLFLRNKIKVNNGA